MPERRVERRQLDRERDLDPRAHRLHQLDVARLDRRGVVRGIGGDLVEVQLERVGARLLDQAGVFDPAAERGAVETRDHRDAQTPLGRGDPLQIRVRTHLVTLEIGQVVERFGEDTGARLERVVDRERIARELFLEERGQHHRGHAGIFESPQAVERAGERRRRGDQRRAQHETEVMTRQIRHDAPSGSGFAGASTTLRSRPASCV